MLSAAARVLTLHAAPHRRRGTCCREAQDPPTSFSVNDEGGDWRGIARKARRTTSRWSSTYNIIVADGAGSGSWALVDVVGGVCDLRANERLRR